MLAASASRLSTISTMLASMSAALGAGSSPLPAPSRASLSLPRELK